MNKNTTNKTKLELKKTAIANLTLSEAQMKMVIGGNLVTKPISGSKPPVEGDAAGGNCTGMGIPSVANDTN